jgi:hypothetical protein
MKEKTDYLVETAIAYPTEYLLGQRFTRTFSPMSLKSRVGECSRGGARTTTRSKMRDTLIHVGQRTNSQRSATDP